jgi:holo-[acyl-carrier protein] synthase
MDMPFLLIQPNIILHKRIYTIRKLLSHLLPQGYSLAKTSLAGQSYTLVIMIQGLGIDLVEVGRIKKALDKWGRRFLHRVFTSRERDYCMRKALPAQSLAARFAAKEAVLKAMGTGLSGGIRWTDMEVVNDPKGKPELHISAKIADMVPGQKFLLSISHSQQFAIAQVILVKSEPESLE